MPAGRPKGAGLLKDALPGSRAAFVVQQIKVAKLVTRLTQHALGELKEDATSNAQRPMDASQVAAAKLLLDKALSNAPQRQELSGPDGGGIPHVVKVLFGDAP